MEKYSGNFYFTEINQIRIYLSVNHSRYYQGHLPILVTSDLSLVEEIFIKQYSNFSARKMGHLDRSDNSPYASLFNAVRGRWKRMRNIMNPTFSSSKLKEVDF